MLNLTVRRSGVNEGIIRQVQPSAGCVPFFFSSRRRHTRFDCDWSSDVCSSDLTPQVVDGGVVRDLEEPVRELALRGLVAVETAERLHEGVLSQVLGQRPVAHHTGDEVEHRTLEAVDQLPVSALGTAERVLDELFVGRLHWSSQRRCHPTGFTTGRPARPRRPRTCARCSIGWRRATTCSTTFSRQAFTAAGVPMPSICWPPSRGPSISTSAPERSTWRAWSVRALPARGSQAPTSRSPCWPRATPSSLRPRYRSGPWPPTRSGCRSPPARFAG